MTGEEKAEFLAAYDQHRVKGQFDWYGARAAEYRRSARHA